MDEVIKLSDQLRRKAKDYCDKPNDPLAEQLLKMLEQFYGQAKMHITSEKLEWKLKEIRTALEKLKVTEGIDTVYDYDHIDDMHDRAEDLRKILEKLSRQ